MFKRYPAHFYEPIRIKIAVSQLQHDFRKLFPSVSSKEWTKIDRDIAGWFEGDRFELEPAHDFWNIFGGFARGLKLKSILSWVTADNVAWTEEEVLIDNIQITWDYPGLKFMGKAPYGAKEVREKLNNDPDIKDWQIENSDEHSKKFPPRDQFPIILFHDKKGGLITSRPGHYVLEGNRRTMRAIIKDRTSIRAFVGRFKSESDFWPEHYWFRTGILRDLIFMAIGFDKGKDKKSFDFTRKFYQLILRDFEVARISTINISFKNFETSRRFLLDIMLKDLK